MGLVDPNGQSHRPLLKLSRKWWVIPATRNNQLYTFHSSFPRVWLTQMQPKESITTRVVLWRNGLCCRLMASCNLKEWAARKWSTSIRLERTPHSKDSYADFHNVRWEKQIKWSQLTAPNQKWVKLSTNALKYKDSLTWGFSSILSPVRAISTNVANNSTHFKTEWYVSIVWSNRKYGSISHIIT